MNFNSLLGLNLFKQFRKYFPILCLKWKYLKRGFLSTFIFSHPSLQKKFLNYIFPGTRTLRSASLLIQDLNFLSIWVLLYFANISVINTGNFISNGYLTPYVNCEIAGFNPTAFFCNFSQEMNKIIIRLTIIFIKH
jgi:hypothetical protein